MTFEHAEDRVAALAWWTRSSTLDDQAQNHLVDPDADRRFDEPSGSTRCKSIARSDRVVQGRAGAHRARATAVRSSAELKRDLGVIDFGDQIELAMQGGRAEHPEVGARLPRPVRRGAARRVPGHERRAGPADGGAVRRRPPRHRGGRPRPEHLRVARRVPLQPARVPDAVPPRRRRRGRSACRCSRTSARGRGSCTRPTRSSRRSRPRSGPTPTSGSCPGRPTARARSRSPPHLDELDRGALDRRADRRAARRRRRLVRRRGALPHAHGCSSCCSRRSRSARSPSRSSGSPGCSGCPRSWRCSRTRAPPTTRWPRSRSRGSCMGPRYRVGLQGPRGASRGWAKGKNYAWREEGGDDEDTPFLFAEALEHLDEIEGLSDEGRARLAAFRDELRALRVRGAPARRRVPGRGDPAHRASSTSWTPTSTGRSPAQRARNLGGVPRPGARVRAGRGRAHAARVPRLRRCRRGARQGGVGAGAALATRTP